MFEPRLLEEAAALLDLCRKNELTIATVESCTGGLLAGLLTHIPGSSDVFERGFVTYSNSAKSSMVGVAPFLIEEHGAVSEPVARAMADGGLKAAPVSLSVAITGIAGPGGATAHKPVGLVHFALARLNRSTLAMERHFCEYDQLDRGTIRDKAVWEALNLLAIGARSFSALDQDE